MGETRVIELVRESNRIEGIHRDPTESEVAEHVRFMGLLSITTPELQNFVSVYQPNAVLRDRHGLDVRVGNYYPPKGGPHLALTLTNLLENLPNISAWHAHIRYEQIHPFTDGNGRSGRMLWYWKMRELEPSLSFLHRFYYQTLQSVP